ncbi:MULTISPECIES: ATP-dependent zinc metalloprotease FtsH [Prochlorococcus]|uniref:ATP-dependent zinc metalloprotease FtsH n=1 Tax=Prochlorococcus TaxID=1218 RepID=UPI000533BBBA|nr:MULTISPECIES: ATP-dependent zinc metalloprotease FtsH [Prochlorococcus]KGG12435.1 Cell division protein FtsH [Prochlorococcus sp. MIT 0601]
MSSYSNLLKDISSGNIESLVYIPARREVVVTYNDGSSAKVSVLPNDQRILRLAQENNTILTVKDLRQEQALASLFGSLSIFFIFFIAITLLIRRSSNIANKTFGFLNSKDSIDEPNHLNTRFHDVAGISEALIEIKEIVSFLKSPEVFEKIGAKLPKGFLLVGPPGTGKTLLARAIAGEANVPFFSISASEFVELFVGVGASRVRGLFKKALANSPSIIFIDEIDAIGRQRGEGIGGGNDEREQTLNQLLTEIDGFADNSGVIIIAATNRPDVLDTALTRPGRFDRTIDIPLPDRQGRLDILSVHARTKPLEPDITLAPLALKTSGFSGADLSNLLNEAAILAARKNKNRISNNELNEALDKLSLGPMKSPLSDSKNKIVLAYHEAGRALVAYSLPSTEKIDKISILPNARGISGFTRFTPDEEIIDSGLITKGYLLSRLIRALGGRAAELIVFGKNEITQVSINDIQEATLLAREMVTKYGFSTLGPVSLDLNERSTFLSGALVRSSKPIAQKTIHAIDKEIVSLINTAMSKAIELLKPLMNKMDLLAEELLEVETLSYDKFIHIVDIDRKQTPSK